MSELAHLLEDALEAFSEKRVSPSKSVFNLFLQSVDFSTDLSEAASKGDRFQGDLEPLLKRLEDVSKGKLPQVETHDEDPEVTTVNDEQPEPPVVIQRTEKIEESKKDLHILVVDDSSSTREIEKSILESYGYRVDVAFDGIEGLEKAKNFQYNFVVTDIEMPKLDGFSLTEALRKEEKHFFIPIIIVSSRDREEDKKRGCKLEQTHIL